MLQVSDHKRFCCFEYQNEPSSTYQLGDVLFKDYVEESILKSRQKPQVGVVIQTFSDGDFRTDMWGMSSESEVRAATIKDIKKYRNDIMEYLLIK
jgi:hypothetical protein